MKIKLILLTFISIIIGCINNAKNAHSSSSIDLCEDYSVNKILNDTTLLENYFLSFFEEVNKEKILSKKDFKFIRVINFNTDDTCSIFSFSFSNKCMQLGAKKSNSMYFNLIENQSMTLFKNVSYLYNRKILYFSDYQTIKGNIENLDLKISDQKSNNFTSVEYYDGIQYSKVKYALVDIEKFEDIINKLK